MLKKPIEAESWGSGGRVSRVFLLLCIHNHQPVGNFDHVIEEAYERAYHPFIEILSTYPDIKVTLHYSGVLLSWFAEKKKDFIDLLLRLRERGQVEILGGGMYEPVLSLLPERDRIGQIEKMSGVVREIFGRKPRGMWLAERVWEPDFPVTLKRARMEYLPLDDYHFMKAGAAKEDLTGYFITERNGYSVKVFPGLERLRYSIPFRDPRETLAILNELRYRGDAPAAVFADDGEKFGVWPGTWAHVYADGWLRKFFDLIQENAAWLGTDTFAGYLDSNPPKGRIYLPSTSYPEMGEWSLPAEKARRFGTLLKRVREGQMGEVADYLQGGSFNSFLSKYEEANQMHKRMLLVSERVEKAKGRVDGEEAESMVDALYRSQCNDAYWHGVFGGLYLPHLRDAVYRNMLTSESKAEEILRQGKEAWTEILRGDFNRDGKEEVLIRNFHTSLILHPDDGGSISEFAFPRRGFNALNVLTRRVEGYHMEMMETLGKGGGMPGEGIESIHDGLKFKDRFTIEDLEFDDGVLRSNRDEFYGEGTQVEDILSGSIKPLYSTHTLVGKPSCMVSGEKGAVKVVLTGQKSLLPLDMEKMILLEGNTQGARIRVKIREPYGRRLSLLYGNVWHINFLAPREKDRFYVSNPTSDRKMLIGERGSFPGVTSFGIYDGWQKCTFLFEGDDPFDALFKPIETISLSEGGVERIYQGARILLLFPLRLPPRGEFEMELSISLK